MARFKRSGRSRPSSRGGRYQWYQGHVDAVSVAQDGRVATDLLSGMDNDLQAGATVVRIVGSWAARVESNDLDGAITFTVYKLTREQFNAVEFHEAQADEGDIMFHDVVFSQFGTLSTQGEAYRQRTIDIRSKRKLRGRDDTIVVVNENISTDATNMVRVFALRTLLYLP